MVSPRLSTLLNTNYSGFPPEVSIPAFTHRTLGAECSLHSYAVVACILHCGATANAGHYTVRYLNHMSPREAPEAPPQWIADDSKPTQSVRIRPINDGVLGQQCYLALLCRTEVRMVGLLQGVPASIARDKKITLSVTHVVHAAILFSSPPCILLPCHPARYSYEYYCAHNCHSSICL